MADNETGSTTLSVDKSTKSRFDSFKRNLEASRDVNMTNSAVLEALMDDFKQLGDH